MCRSFFLLSSGPLASIAMLALGILRTWPHFLQRFILFLSMMFCCPVFRLSSSSLTTSNYLIFIIFHRHPFSNLLMLCSVSVRPFDDSHSYHFWNSPILLNIMRLTQENLIQLHICHYSHTSIYIVIRKPSST